MLSSNQRNITSVQDEKQWTQDLTLWDNMQERGIVGCDAMECDSLESVCKVRPEPLQNRYTEAKRHLEKDNMVNSIEGST